MKILWLPVLAMFVGCSPETPATPKLTGDPFDPEKSLYPEFPITRVLIVKHEPVRGYFAFGELPQFRVTFSNNSETVVDVSGTPIDGTRFRPYIFLHILREDGRDVGYGTDLIVATNVSRILPGSTFQIDFHGSNIVATRTEFYLHDPDILLPGKYQCYFQFWIDRQGEPERLLSPLNPIVVVDDGSSDAQISKAVQTARGINDHLALVIRGDKDNLISLTAQNNGTEPLYLGHDWTWR